MSKLDSKPMQSAQLSKSTHDLNHVYDFTSSTGMILPLVCDILNPGESIDTKIDLSQTRTQPLDAAAYLDLDLHVDYFFVPMTILMSKFESFIYRIKDFYSNVDNNNFDLPLLDLDQAKSQILPDAYNRVISIGIGANFDDLGKGCLRLFDHLGYGTLLNSSVSGWTVYSAYNPKVFPWALLAYNAAYEYYYINDEYEAFINNLFNVDSEVNQGTDIDTISTSFTQNICSLKYRNKYHDYFTRVKASPIVSGNNLLDSAGSLSLAKSWLSRSQSTSYGVSQFDTLVDGVVGSIGTVSSSPLYPDSHNTRTNFGFATALSSNDPDVTVYNGTPNGQDINTANLRALFANEKLWTITGMNRKQYDAQTLAHFGFDVPTDVLHQVQHIGHHLYNLKVGEVISTAGTANQPLATVAGKGYAFDNNDKNIRFTAPCHGVFIALYSSAIHRNYFGAFRKENAIGSWQDFYQPEFDHLGMQPMFLFETRQDRFGSSGSFDYGTILGWQYRYEQFKSRYDRSSLAFANDFIGGANVFYSGPFSSWGPSDLPLEGVNFTSMGFVPSSYMKWVLKESPCELNNMMTVAYDPRWYEGASGETLDYLNNPWLAYTTDPLIHHALIHYKKLSTMSAYSMPKLND